MLKHLNFQKLPDNQEYDEAYTARPKKCIKGKKVGLTPIKRRYKKSSCISIIKQKKIKNLTHKRPL
jgi:hypothetical protein